MENVGDGENGDSEIQRTGVSDNTNFEIDQCKWHIFVILYYISQCMYVCM